MFPNAAKPATRFQPGTRVQIVQFVRVGHRRWKTQCSGTVLGENIRPVGGMEMGSRAFYCLQPTLTIKKDDGELTTVALDENTEVNPLGAATTRP